MSLPETTGSASAADRKASLSHAFSFPRTVIAEVQDSGFASEPEEFSHDEILALTLSLREEFRWVSIVELADVVQKCLEAIATDAGPYTLRAAVRAELLREEA